MGKQFVEFNFAENGPERGLGELGGLIDVIWDFNHGLIGVDDAQKYHGIDFERDVVAGDDVLRRNL